MGRFLVGLGIGIVIVGLAIHFGGPLGLGKLPGDITVKGDRYAFYFPITTCILVSAVISLVMWIFRRFVP